MSDVTRILSAIAGGDPHTGEQLLPIVHDELYTVGVGTQGIEETVVVLQCPSELLLVADFS